MWYGKTITEKMPSGMEVTFRGVDILSLVAAGHIPSRIIGIVSSLEGAKTLPAEAMGEYVGILDAYCCAAMVSPVVTPDGKNGSLKAQDVPMQDKLYLFQRILADGVTDKAASFRQGPDSDAAAGSAGDAVSREAIGGHWP